MKTVLALVILLGPDGQPIELNPNSIVTMRAPRSVGQAVLTPGVQCVITTSDGKLVNVMDTCEEVRAKLAGSK